MMETKDILRNLESLFKLDVDAVHAYDQALQKIDVPKVRERLMDFKADHERHVNDISSAIQRLGGNAPERSRDFKGFLIEGFTAIRSVTGTEGALRAMKTNENLTNKTYSGAVVWDLPEDIMKMVRRNRDDEQRHLQYINECINTKVWEEAHRETA